MTYHGHIENGAVVVEGLAEIPDGTEVTVIIAQQPPVNQEMTPEELEKYKAALAEINSWSNENSDRMTPEEKRRQMEALAQIDALPNENPGDDFSGADHDKILYGPFKGRLMP